MSRSGHILGPGLDPPPPHHHSKSPCNSPIIKWSLAQIKSMLLLLLLMFLIVQTVHSSTQFPPPVPIIATSAQQQQLSLDPNVSSLTLRPNPPIPPATGSASFSLYTLPHHHQQQQQLSPPKSSISPEDILIAAKSAVSSSPSSSSSKNKDNKHNRVSKLNKNNPPRHLLDGGDSLAAILNRSNHLRMRMSSPGSPSPAMTFVYSSSSSSSSDSDSSADRNSGDESESGSCLANCSGHGDCYNGTCFCEVEYSGGSCNDPNLKFYLSFSSVYYMICVVSFIQLMLCINSEIARQKPRSISRAFRISTQKALYFFICLGTAIRGFYFSSPSNVHIRWAESLMSAYYPLLMSGSSLLVCFWAEVFHLDVSVERSRFLSKSFTGFVLFNVVTYSMLLAELVLLTFANPTDSDKGFFLSIFNSIYAFLMLIVVIFFLIYGVEVYFKVRGAFIQEESCPADISQLQQSRLGLISQAVLLLVTILFMFSEVLGSFWKDKVPVLSRNYHQIMFRVVEFGVALWFPCVLWNCIQPERLWILNPRRILKRRPNFMMSDSSRFKTVGESELLVGGVLMMKNCPMGTSSKSLGSCNSSGPECWICYESMESKPDAGPLIQPCDCRGDVSAVHHQCLLRWLMESYTTPNCPVHCKVCGAPYRMEHTSETVWLPAGLTITHWFKTAAIVTIMSSTLAGSCMMVKIFEHMYVKTISVGCAILVEYICLRLLGFNMISAYHRAKFSAIKIIGRKITSDDNHDEDDRVNIRQQCSDNPDNPYQDPQCSGTCYQAEQIPMGNCHNIALHKNNYLVNSKNDQSDCDSKISKKSRDLKSSMANCGEDCPSKMAGLEQPQPKQAAMPERQLPLRTLSEQFVDSGAEQNLCSSVGCSHSCMNTAH